jgi:hypothetical protein
LRSYLFAGVKKGTEGTTWDPIEPSAYDILPTRTGFRNHGSLVASKVVGIRYGVAKNANLIVVKWPRGRPLAGALYPTALFDGLERIVSDLQPKKQSSNKPGIAVIDMSFGFSLSPALKAQFSDFIDQLIRMDVVVVAASGNCRFKIDPDSTGATPCPVSRCV